MRNRGWDYAVIVAIGVLLLAMLAMALDQASPRIAPRPVPFELLGEAYDYRGERAAIAYATDQWTLRRAEPDEDVEHDPDDRQRDDQDQQQGAENVGSVPGAMDRAARVVAECESNHDWTVTNPQSSASGAFQFLDQTWRRVARAIGVQQYPRARDAPPSVQLRAFEYLWSGGSGSHHWNASRPCWGPRL